MDHFLRLPDEILVEILTYCDSSDLENLQNTCRKLKIIAESTFLWKRLWRRLVRKLQLDVALKLPAEPFQANYQEMHRRLNCVIPFNKSFLGDVFYKNIVVDIGSKTSWVITDTLTRRHPTVVALSSADSPIKAGPPMTMSVSSGAPQPYCWHCQQNGAPLHSQLYATTSGRNKAYDPRIVGSSCSNDTITNVNPLDALQNNADFTIYSFFLKHILLKECPEIRRRPTSVVLCDSGEVNVDARRKITRILFEEIKAVRICFVNKAAAASAAIALETCLVVDSGANNTVVTPVVDGQARLESSRRKPIGGMCVAYYLAKSLELKGYFHHAKVAVTKLDDSRLKAHCSLPLRPKYLPNTRNVTLQLPASTFPDTSTCVMEPVVFGTELHLAPEMMYATLDLPDMIRQLLTAFNEPVKRALLSHILLIGGNCALDGLKMRLTWDLKLAMGQEYSSIINVHRPVASSIFDPLIVLTEGNKDWPRWITREDYIIQGELATH